MTVYATALILLGARNGVFDNAFGLYVLLLVVLFAQLLRKESTFRDPVTSSTNGLLFCSLGCLLPLIFYFLSRDLYH